MQVASAPSAAGIIAVRAGNVNGRRGGTAVLFKHVIFPYVYI